MARAPRRGQAGATDSELRQLGSAPDDNASTESVDGDAFGTFQDNPPFHGPPKHICLIASTQRSGSYFLSHLLTATGRMGAPLEYLHPGFLATWQEKFGQPDRAATVKELFRRRTSPNGWFALKAHWSHYAAARDDPQLHLLFNIDRFIFIERRDRIAQAVSLATVAQTGSWISLQPTRVQPRYSAREIASALVRIDAEYRRWRDYFDANGIEPVHVYYEDLVANPEATLNRLLAHCGLDPVEQLPEVAITPQASPRNEEWKSRFGRSPYAKMLVSAATLRRLLARHSRSRWGGGGGA